MVKFRKKPVVVGAELWDGFFNEEITQYHLKDSCDVCDAPHRAHGWIGTLEGGHRVCPDDWIITGVKGERYPCKPDIFEMTYEKV